MEILLYTRTYSPNAYGNVNEFFSWVFLFVIASNGGMRIRNYCLKWHSDSKSRNSWCNCIGLASESIDNSSNNNPLPKRQNHNAREYCRRASVRVRKWKNRVWKVGNCLLIRFIHFAYRSICGINSTMRNIYSFN